MNKIRNEILELEAKLTELKAKYREECPIDLAAILNQLDSGWVICPKGNAAKDLPELSATVTVTKDKDDYFRYFICDNLTGDLDPYQEFGCLSDSFDSIEECLEDLKDTLRGSRRQKFYAYTEVDLICFNNDEDTVIDTLKQMYPDFQWATKS